MNTQFKRKYRVQKGDKYNYYTVIGDEYRNAKKHWVVECECCCGKNRTIELSSLVSGKRKSCGCNGTQFNIHVGQKFGKLEVISEPYRKLFLNYIDPKEIWVVTCKCDCGKEVEVIKANLLLNDRKSCGCLKDRFYDMVSIGEKFNNWTVLSKPNNKNKSKEWRVLCECKCGARKEVDLNYLTVGNAIGCGCNKIKYHFTIGDKYNELTVISETFTNDENERTLLVQCSCGQKVKINAGRLVRGQKTCLACARKNTGKLKIIHGMCHSRIYRTWSGMKERCYNPKRRAYQWYGAKGIKICDEWLDFNIFKDWAYKNGYNDNLTIERFDPNKNYCPENCEWITKSENSRRRNAYYRDKISELQSEITILEQKNQKLLQTFCNTV